MALNRPLRGSQAKRTLFHGLGPRSSRHAGTRSGRHPWLSPSNQPINYPGPALPLRPRPGTIPALLKNGRQRVADTPIRSLDDIWPLQAELNRRAGFDTLGLGRQLAAGLADGTLAEAGGLRVEVGRAVKNYLDALAGECAELHNCLAWKHWYREARQGRQYELGDVQNARVEATDMLFFWISLCQLLGLEPQDIYRLYAAKLGINHRRQDEDRSQAEHGEHEAENRGVM